MISFNNAVEKHREKILEAERYIWKNPETGYKEYKTSRYMAEDFQSFGYELTFVCFIKSRLKHSKISPFPSAFRIQFRPEVRSA